MPSEGFPEAAPTAFERWRRWRLPMVLAVVGWVVVLGLGLLALLRVVAWDDLEPLALLNTVTLFVYLPAWLVAIVAGIGRRPFLAGAALVVVVVQVAFLYPEFSAATPAPSWTHDAATVRLLDANVYDQNPSMAGYVRQIAEISPELVTMEECTTTDVEQLRQSGVLAKLPYQVEVKRYDPWAFFVASRWRLSDTKIVYFYGVPLVVETTVHLPSGPFRLWVIHTVAPVPATFTVWRNQLTHLEQLIRARGTNGLFVVGDFNATWGNRGFRGILDTGLVDGAAARGQALDMTWSQLWGIVPPLVRIDHTLTGGGLAVTQITTGTGVGSDHRDLIATIARQGTSGG